MNPIFKRPIFEKLKKETKSGKEKVMSDLIYFVNRWSKERMDLSNLGLESLSPEMFKLNRIKLLDLSNNNLKALPIGFENLTSLEVLNLSNNNFHSFPSVGCLPPSLKKVILRGNKITHVDFRGAKTGLASIISVDLENNQIETFYSAPLQQNNLKELNLRGNRLKTFYLNASSSLASLNLSRNAIRESSLGIHPANNIKHIYLGQNGLKEIPLFVLNCTRVTTLDLSSNELTFIPVEIIERLTSLERFLLNDNQLTTLPVDFHQMSELCELQISQNRIRTLPPELSRIANLKVIEAFENPLESPPKAVVEQGSSATMRFLKEIDVQSSSGDQHRLWTSKLMIVGEGGVGKTSLVKALKGEAYDKSEYTTHGIRLESIEIQHPQEQSVQMHLNIWDFGGQQIYHATHQFFLTDNSVFVFAWNARTEFNQGRPYYWLDMITANAPNAPIILVATHLDERREQIPFDYLQEKYPQISSFLEVSNLDRQGIEALYSEIRELATNLPLMGKPWPKRWEEAKSALRESNQKFISRKELMSVFNAYSLDAEESEVLARYLHDLGELLQYPESETLIDLVILQPQWISEYISKVITSGSLLDSKGLLNQETVSKEWADLGKPMQELFLDLMEQYDLAYKVPGNSDNRAIVVEQLHPDRPEGYQSWRQLLERKDLKKVEIEYRLSSMQPGLPTWFIARSHRFSIGVHWRNGAIFADGKDRRNHALIESFEHEKLIRLTSVGDTPHNFLSILKDGLELTFARYPGMKIRSFVPCPENLEDLSCDGRFPYQRLEEALDRGLSSMQCQSCFNQAEIKNLLFGIGGVSTELFTNIEEKVSIISDLLPTRALKSQEGHSQFEDQVFLIHHVNRIISQAISELNQTQSSELREIRQMLAGISDNFDLLHRRFTAQFKAIQGSSDFHCPSTFLFKSGDKPENLISNLPLELHLLCQNPKQIHPATIPIGGDKQYTPYTIQRPKEWLIRALPYVKALSQLVSYAPIIPNSPFANAADLTEKCLEHMEYFVQQVDNLAEASTLPTMYAYDGEIAVDGAQLRSFRSMLDKIDPSHNWQGLKKWLSPEGHYLWLCPHHYAQCGKHFDAEI